MPRSINPVMPWSKTRQLDRMRQGLPAKLQPVLALVPTHVGTARPRHRSACMPSDGGCGGAHPIGINTGTGRTTAHNTHVGGNAPNYGTDYVASSLYYFLSAQSDLERPVPPPSNLDGTMKY
ncbi:hypothetical protein ACFX2I_014128 [Malus domestica]